MKPEWFSFSSGTSIEVTVLAERILAIPDLDGVTFSGGEPFEQAPALARLSRELRSSGLHILAYTGYRLSVVQQDIDRFGSLLAEVDYVIDGEYRLDLPGPFRWRGSQNQAIYDMRRNRRLDLENECDVRELQLTMGTRGLRITGFPNHAVVETLTHSLARRGIRLEKCDGDYVA
jgi:anaerobic ribonucleoside-triphosphate reductase activating protein